MFNSFLKLYFKVDQATITKQISEYPYGICNVEVQQNYAVILCELCNKWNHTNCVQVHSMNYAKLKSDPTPWHCTPCINELPFANTSKSDFVNLYCASKSPK